MNSISQIKNVKDLKSFFNKKKSEGKTTTAEKMLDDIRTAGSVIVSHYSADYTKRKNEDEYFLYSSQTSYQLMSYNKFVDNLLVKDDEDLIVILDIGMSSKKRLVIVEDMLLFKQYIILADAETENKEFYISDIVVLNVVNKDFKLKA